MCGEHYARRVHHGDVVGSSPHVRGARRQVETHALRWGIIPACAGSTYRSSRTALCPRDHPRMCGEHHVVFHFQSSLMGSSPHVRGARCGVPCTNSSIGIIPACAGSTPPTIARRFSSGDHPRMCGEHPGITRISLSSTGSSPHVRGALTLTLLSMRTAGIIPACAGSTSLISCTAVLPRDHPRMCGEHTPLARFSTDSGGSSPHVRGARDGIGIAVVAIGIIPACAGSTVRCPNPIRRPRDHPRMCGEHASKIA